MVTSVHGNIVDCIVEYNNEITGVNKMAARRRNFAYIFLNILVIMLLWAGFLSYYKETILRHKEASKHVSHRSEFKHV
jgi:hypothetical protein